MNDVRIPFALDKATNSLVEVGDVRRGRQCGCICPSCKQGVIARHGEVNSWHFSHDQNAIDKPVKECDISFDSCCRQYAIELLLQGYISRLRTPNYEVSVLIDDWSEDELKISVTGSHMLENIIVEKSSKYDIYVKLGEFILFIFLGYESRMVPMSPDDAKSGLLYIDIGSIKNQFYTTKTTTGLLKSLLKNLIEDSFEYKKWLYHPSEVAARVELNNRLQQKISNIHENKCESLHYIDTANTSLVMKSNSARNGKFTCVICNVSWDGSEFHDITCPKCNKYIYSRFKADD